MKETGKRYVDEIISIARNMRIDFTHNEIIWHSGEEQFSISTPTRPGSKRKLAKGYFWIRYLNNTIEFWLPKNADLEELSRRIGLRIDYAPLTHKTGGAENLVLSTAPLEELDLTNGTHRDFIAYVIDARTSSKKSLTTIKEG